MKAKNISFVFLFLLTLVLLVACGGNSDNNGYDAYTNDNSNDVADQDPEGIINEIPNQAENVLSVAVIEGPFASHLSVIANRMESDMADEGVDITINLNVIEFEDIESHVTRMSVGLMAGQHLYDVFDPWWHNVHALRDRGFILDFNELLYNDPIRNRDDYFENVLGALEVGGRLYTFPMFFRPDMIGINNRRVPQVFIDRFSQYASISILEMMRIQNDIHELHPDLSHLGLMHEVDNFFGCSRSPVNILMREAESHINFTTRTSNLTAPNFVEFISNINTAFGDISHLFGDSSGMVTGIIMRNSVRHVEQGVFTLYGGNMRVEESLFNVVNPYFVHSVPFVDNEGRLHISGIHLFSISAATVNPDLAWEFVARVADSTRVVDYSIAMHIPINRVSAESRIRDLMYAFTIDTRFTLPLADDTNINNQIDEATGRLMDIISMPMTTDMSLPTTLVEDILEYFLLDVITAETAAQQLQNRISLWLIE